MSSSDTDLIRVVRSWIRAPESASAERIVDAVLFEVETEPQARRRWPSPWVAFTGSPIPLGLAVAAVLVVALVAVSQVQWTEFPGGPPSSTEPSATASTSPAAVDPDDIGGIPPAGTAPTDPTPGELVMRFEPSTPWMTSWLFADGRLITFRYDDRPADADDAYIGLIQQRLHPDGVEYLTSRIISTGLFESDLALLHEGAGFLNLDVRNGERLVHLGWGHRAWGPAWQVAPTATQAQAQALFALIDTLSDPASWPASAWADRTEVTFVPAHYGICVRGVPDPVDPDRVWELLPPAAQDLRDGGQVPDQSMGGADPSCATVTTNDARELARILAGAGIERMLPRFSGEIWLRYAFDDPDRPGNELWISFGPVLPHGEAIWLGPG